MVRFTRELMALQGVRGGSLMAAFGPLTYSRKGHFFFLAANALCLTTYLMMINWIYEGYVDLWYGVYGLDDDDDDDDD
ncbi:hypothetical protein STCU_10633 [Strigomonas culicis]|uniref:Uncharacterized protein n=1 Tax=Strigomonas culicis TaxID=28005 RepID=S9US31_9TRYP|nr:hypothetical protein STCU_10633 [Strigomonas culicis]|eukprot:EPY17411.1 hypothetical protein STCU_10633 [Strigomonas culicis]